MKYEPDKSHEVTVPGIGDAVYVHKADTHGEIIEHESFFPMWSFGNGIDGAGYDCLHLQSRLRMVFGIRHYRNQADAL